MWARLKDRIIQLKTTSKLRTKRRKHQGEQLRMARRHINLLEAENAALHARLGPTKVAQHRYPAELIALAVFIVVQAGGSLRCAASTVAFVSNLLGWSYGRPSPTTVRDWVLRCGYQAVLDTRQLAGHYAVIIDESIQIGKEKLLLMLGVRLSDQFCYCAPLTGREVEVLGLEVQASWTGVAIEEFIHRNLAERPAVKAAYFISDCGSSILCALRSLDVDWVSDCTHVMMNLVKNLFSKDAALSKLSAQLGQLRRQLTLAEWNGLLPATLRDKDRFLRLFTIVEWAQRMDAYWAKLPPAARRHVAFYRRAGGLLRRLTQVRDLVRLAAGILKTAGLSKHSQERWRQVTDTYRSNQQVLTHQARRFIKGMDAYFADHAALWDDHQQLLCCSDIVESTFGRYKNKGGMKAISADVLAIPLYNREMSVDFVKAALEKVSGQTVLEWQTQYVCHNRYGVRKRMDAELKSGGTDG